MKQICTKCGIKRIRNGKFEREENYICVFCKRVIMKKKISSKKERKGVIKISGIIIKAKKALIDLNKKPIDRIEEENESKNIRKT